MIAFVVFFAGIVIGMGVSDMLDWRDEVREREDEL